MTPRVRARILGTGSFVPPYRMTNADFEKIVDTSDEWIVSRTGIRERRIAGPDTSCADMAAEAARRAMNMAGCVPEEIDLLINGTVTPDYRLPSNACTIQELLGLPNAAAFDVVSACTGFINGLSVANSLMVTGQYRKALVIGSEKLSSIINYQDRTTCVLFGDGAGAAVLEPSDNERGVVATFLRSNGSLREWLWMKTGGSRYPYTRDFAFDGTDKILMNGADVFKVAVREMCNAALNVLKQARLKADDIALLVPHQANNRIIDAVAKRLRISDDKVYKNIAKYGNTSAASVPLALDEANREGRLKPGDNIVMVAFGSGLIWGAALVRW